MTLPRNIVENAVRETLQAHRGVGEEDTCWCPLCTADMQALALSSLPPRYVTRRAGDLHDEATRRDAVRAEVARAVRHVGHHRKHPSGAAVPAEETVAIVNLAFEIGFALIEERLQGLAGACTCTECRCDAVAFALNRFPSRYGVAISGRSVFLEGLRRETAAEMASFLELGASVVAAHPRHGTA